MGAGTNAGGELSVEELKVALEQLRAELEQLRAENRRLAEEIGLLRGDDASWNDVKDCLRSRLLAALALRLPPKKESESECDRLRRRAKEQREAKKRRAAARGAADPRRRGRGKRKPRPPFVADETIEIHVPAAELPADAAPNGFVERHFYGMSIVRHNVLIRLHEYVSPAEGRIIAKLPEGWRGEFTPDTHVTVDTLSMGGMTEPKIKELFADHGVRVSAGQINNVLLATADKLRDEQLAAHRAGIENSPSIGIDGTHTTCDGEPMVCHILGNEVFTSMTTTEHKDRVTVIGVLAGAPVGHCVGEHALAHQDLTMAARELLRRVSDGEPVCDGADQELLDLSSELRTTGLDAAKMDRFLDRAIPDAVQGVRRHIREATAGQWLRTVITCLPLVMLADGGTNYHGILAFLQLCWIHMLRPFSLLPESADGTRVLFEGWALYRRLCAWRDVRDAAEATAIAVEFDRVFDPERCTDASVRRQLGLTRTHKAQLLTVLHHRHVPPENNGQERGAKARVRKGDIRFGPRSARGLRAWDTMQSVVGTLRKLRISPAAFMADRITRQRRFEPLDTIVKRECIRRYGPPAPTPGTF